MGKKVISVEHVSKIYRLGEIGTGTLSSDVNRWWVTKVLGKEDPYLKIGQVNDRSTKGDTDVVYSLKDVSFDVEQGEVLGIIGKNGAGKSTLLKILSRITAPTTGRVRMKGRVASLLEVGTGFHPELTGRENIFLNGSILGMRKHEIARKLDEIIEFSGVERYIDTPVKRYSSGMYVRLAFAVAAHLESEILIVDEVLAVGDAEFQKKCLGRMKDVSVNEGRTVLFVSHNLGSLLNICTRGLLIEKGKSIDFDSIHSATSFYLNDINKIGNEFTKGDISNDLMSQIVQASISYESNRIGLNVKFKSTEVVPGLVIGFVLSDAYGNPICGFNNKFFKTFNQINSLLDGQFEILTDKLFLHSGSYYVSLFIGDLDKDFEQLQNVLRFDVVNREVEYAKAPAISVIGPISIGIDKFKVW